LDWEGNEILAGTLTVGSDPTNNMEVATKQYVDNNGGNGVFTAEYGVTSYVDIKAAIDLGKAVIITQQSSSSVAGDILYYVTYVDSADDSIHFASLPCMNPSSVFHNSYYLWYGQISTSNNYSSQVYSLQQAHVKTSLTLDYNNWDQNNTITVSYSRISADNLVQVSPDPTSADDYVDAGILCTAQGTGTLTFTCKTVPTNDITVNVVVWN